MKAWPSQNLNVAVCQMTSTDDVKVNAAQVMERLAQIKDPDQVDLVAFPENSLFFRLSQSSPVQAFDLSEPLFESIKGWADAHSCAVLLGSLPYKDPKGVSNASILLEPGKSPEVVYRKIHLFDVDVEGEKAVRESDQFMHGAEPKVLTIKGWRIGLTICYDLRFAELFLKYRDQGVHLLMVPSAFLVPTGQAHWHVLLRARAIESQAYILAAAQGGVHKSQNGRRETYGHSLVVDPWGRILGEGSQEQSVIQASLDPQLLEKVWKQIPMSNHVRLR